MERVLLAWVGHHDLSAQEERHPDDIGPILRAVRGEAYDSIVLLDGYTDSEGSKRVDAYVSWVNEHTPRPVIVKRCPLSSPVDYHDIFLAASGVVDAYLEEMSGQCKLNFHLSPGTPAMTAVWILLGKTKYNARLLQTSVKEGVIEVDIPFDIKMDFLPELLRGSDKALEKQSQALSPQLAAFQDIKYQSEAMANLIRRAQRVAIRSVPVLIEGESGTGKELLARAIHQASPRAKKELIAINCGALPENLVEATLFGYNKGAFTGAEQDQPGCFEVAHNNTLFLDELGELPLSAQVKLLRVLQEGEVTRLGSHKPISVDVRVIAATNRHLQEEVAEGRFREDLFFRLAVATFRIPPLRERMEDVELLVDTFLEQINEQGENEEPAYEAKILSTEARSRLKLHHWPGNIRELYNTLLRAAIWSEEVELGFDDIEDALMLSNQQGNRESGGILGRPLVEGFDVEKVMGEVAIHYIDRALIEAKNKTQAAKLVGLGSYQTMDKWLEKYKAVVDEP